MPGSLSYINFTTKAFSLSIFTRHAIIYFASISILLDWSHQSFDEKGWAHTRHVRLGGSPLYKVTLQYNSARLLGSNFTETTMHKTQGLLW